MKHIFDGEIDGMYEELVMFPEFMKCLEEENNCTFEQEEK
jgi:hypothetical protein